MFTNANDLQHALETGRYAGVVIYKGPSAIDGAPIIAILTGFGRTRNKKTGPLLQTWIMREDVPPHIATKTGQDESVCGNCPARPVNAGFCYVQVWQAPRSVWETFRRGRYALPGIDHVPDILPGLVAGDILRLGAYGDPAALPVGAWDSTAPYAAARNGYTHQWENRPDLKPYCMASVDTPAQAERARALGWRTFRIRTIAEKLNPKEIICPASHEAGHKTTCFECRACGGNTAKAKVSIAIVAHGAMAKRYLNFRNANAN